MNRRITLLCISVIIGAAALAGALLCEEKSENNVYGQTAGYTDEQILTLPYFDLLAISSENRGLPCDVESYSLGDGYIHLILPNSVNERNVTVCIRDINGNLLARRVYDFSHKVMIGPWEVLLEHHRLPTVYYVSADPDVYNTMVSSETKDITCEGKLYLCGGDEGILNAGWIGASLHGRGASSWEACNDKRSFSLRLDKSMNLLGMGKNRSWNLIGNAFDVSLLRNVVFNRISEEAGIEFQPNMQNVNLYVDGKYRGVYTLTTKMTVDKNRIAMRNGDMFFRKQPDDPVQPIPYSSETWENAGTNEPVAELIFPENAGVGDLKKAQDVFQQFVNSVEHPNSYDLSKICDMKSLAAYYWIQEVSMNIDAWERGVYMFYRESDGRMHMGPVWDMDLTLGSPVPKSGVSFDSPEGWKIRYVGWYPRLFQNEEFANAVRDMYFNGGIRELFRDGITYFESQKESLGNDGYMNHLFYGHANDWSPVLDHGDSYDEYTDNMIMFYRDRIEWIDSEMERAE